MNTYSNENDIQLPNPEFSLVLWLPESFTISYKTSIDYKCQA